MHVNNPALLDRADELWAEGRHQRALQQLRALVDGDPSQLDVRGRLAERYRELGNPDHAGRWGIAVAGWTTELERDRLARLIAARRVPSSGIREFLRVTSDQVSGDAIAEIEAAAETYRNRPRRPKGTSPVEPDTSSEAPLHLTLLAILASLLGAYLVSALATFWEAPPVVARITLLVPVILVACAILSCAIIEAAKRRFLVMSGWLAFAVLPLGIVAAACVTGWFVAA
jgi:hypothetical protein